MAKLDPNLELARCPHCQIDHPHLSQFWRGHTETHSGQNKRAWIAYGCVRCGGLVIAAAPDFGQVVNEVYPEPVSVDAELPNRARSYLEQAIASLHAPAGAVLLAASAVDSMLKSRGYKEGSLYARIEQAAQDGLVTAEMKAWAHDVRLDANEQRHADDSTPLPDEDDARRALDFARALGMVLFVLPARVRAGREDAKPSS